ncbi:MAG: cytochrome c [FCB group bacterium]|nr:cytochrome c [FCB group bacterium]
MRNRTLGLGIIATIVIILNVGCEDKKAVSFVDDNWSDANLVRGGLLYDKWWKINSVAEPTSNFDPIWSSQTTNSRSGSATWRCKECHGWDYIGKNGRYSSGSHYTGFEGVWEARLKDKADVFDAIKDDGGNHDLSAELSDNDVLDLTKFILDGLVDITLYVDANGVALGDTTNGKSLYESACASCHGSDGNSLDFKSDDGIQGVGWAANDNPQEILHKIRWGHPGSDPEMPSMVEKGKSDQDCADILAYSQKLPQ